MSERWLSQPAQRGDFRKAVTSQADDMVKYECNCAPQDTTLVIFQPHGDEVCVSAGIYAAAENFHATS